MIAETHSWYEEFGIDDRQQKEIEFAELYTTEFHHGTDGHNRLMLIAKLCAAIDKLSDELRKSAQ